VSDIRLLHNPKCSKSRGALDHLQARGADLDVVRYLDTPPSRAELEHIVDHLDVEPSELVRKDSYFKELGLDPGDYTTRDAVVELLVAHPRLMERPVAIKGDAVVLGRPPEKVLALLDDA
jgi:arsenate reductase